jgi:PIN domain nuclease of toxin-antitoxin system
VRLLLDTHTLIWAVATPARLSPVARAAITDPRNAVFVSAATAWEIAIKHALGRLTFPVDRFDEEMAAAGFEQLPVRIGHGLAAGGLPRHHADPFDRMLIAQALIEGLTLVSDDAVFPAYAVPLLRPA